MRILLVDDHPLIHLALRTVLQELDPPVTLLSAHDGQEARAQLAQAQPIDMLLLDLQLGHEDGFELMREFRHSHPLLPVVALSVGNQLAEVIRAIDLGAMGFIPKHAGAEDFKQAVLLVVTGGIYVPPMEVSDEPLLLPGEAPPKAAARPLGPPPLEKLPLTVRQREVLLGLLQGKSNKLIAREMGISADTVKDHVQVVFRVLKVNSRTQAVLAVSQLS